MKADREFSKEVQVAKKLFLEVSTSLVIREMQIKTALRFPSPQSEWLRSGEQLTTSVRMWGKGNTYLLFVGVQASAATMEISAVS